jgi:hypothetical protein
VAVWEEMSGKILTRKKSSEIQWVHQSSQEINPAVGEPNTLMRK